MIQPKLKSKYIRAEDHYKKGNYRKAQRLFKIFLKQAATKGLGSINDVRLCNSAEGYLIKLDHMDLSFSRIKLAVLIVLFLGVLGGVLWFL